MDRNLSTSNLPHPVSAWGERMFVAVVLLFEPACHMFLFRLAAMGRATLVERALLIALLGHFEQFPPTPVLSDYNDKPSQTRGGKKHTLQGSHQEADSSRLYFRF